MTSLESLNHLPYYFDRIIKSEQHKLDIYNHTVRWIPNPIWFKDIFTLLDTFTVRSFTEDVDFFTSCHQFAAQLLDDHSCNCSLNMIEHYNHHKLYETVQLDEEDNEHKCHLKLDYGSLLSKRRNRNICRVFFSVACVFDDKYNVVMFDFLCK